MHVCMSDVLLFCVLNCLKRGQLVLQTCPEYPGVPMTDVFDPLVKHVNWMTGRQTQSSVLSVFSCRAVP